MGGTSSFVRLRRGLAHHRRPHGRAPGGADPAHAYLTVGQLLVGEAHKAVYLRGARGLKRGVREREVLGEPGCEGRSGKTSKACVWHVSV